MPAGAFEFLRNCIQKKMLGAEAPNLGLSCPQGPLNFSKMASGENDLGKSPEPRVVVPTGAIKSLKKILQEGSCSLPAPSLRTNPMRRVKEEGAGQMLAILPRIQPFPAPEGGRGQQN